MKHCKASLRRRRLPRVTQLIIQSHTVNLRLVNGALYYPGKERIHQPFGRAARVWVWVGACTVNLCVHCQSHMELVHTAAAARFLIWFEPKEVKVCRGCVHGPQACARTEKGGRPLPSGALSPVCHLQLLWGGATGRWDLLRWLLSPAEGVNLVLWSNAPNTHLYFRIIYYFKHVQRSGKRFTVSTYVPCT